MELLNHISDVIIVVVAIASPILALIEKTQKVNWKPLSKIVSFITGQDAFRDEIREKIKIIEDKIDDIQKNQENLQKNQEETEISIIKDKILAFSSRIQSGKIPTENEFRQIHEIYDVYTNKGYNSYIHTEMEWIMLKENEIKNDFLKK